MTIMHFTTKNNSSRNFDIMYKESKLTTDDSVKFLGLTLDNSLTWKNTLKPLYLN
jgi:hypothetical protein